MSPDRSTRPEDRPLRLFLAVEIPEGAKRAIAEAVAPWQEAFPRANWIPPDNWHVTVKFLGPTWPRLLAWVEEAAEATAATLAPMHARVVGLGAFPTPRRARVLWAGVDEPSGGLVQLSSALDGALAREFPPDPRAFHPHVTTARSDPPLGLPEGFATTTLATEPFTIGELVLFRSHVRRPAPRYEPLRTFPFTA